MEPAGARLNRDLLWLAPLLAVAWTFGFAGVKRFKRRFSAEHAALGSPQLFGSPYERRHWRFVAYLFSFRFLKLGDRVVSVCLSAFVALTLIGLIGVLTLFLKAVP